MAYTTIDDPSVYFQIALYVGNESTNAIFNDGNSDLKPDLVWMVDRSSTSWNSIYDSTRGTTKQLNTNVNNSEYTVANGLTNFNSDGFTLGAHDNENGDGENHVAWQWKANGGTVANDTNGDITTSVQASQTAGFSIATYTGNGGSGQTLGHGLGANADLIIFKDRESASSWRTYVRLLGASKSLNLEDGNAANSSTNIFPSHSTTTIGVEQNDVMNKNNSDFVMYSFRSIQGYSKIGEYAGNSNADGSFIYTGFKPAWLMIKNISATQSWWIFDNKRLGYNGGDTRVRADRDTAESTGSKVDFVSNGFKWRDGDNAWNYTGNTFIYMAFAESPFVSSKGTPTTAR